MSAITLDFPTSVETRKPPPSDQGRIPGLDGIRGIAILSVVVFHYFTAVTAGRSGFLALLHNFFAMGWVGVDLFFVLSGYLIGGILLDARKSPHYFRAFYLRRFYRIIPLYYVWICGYVVLVAVVGPTRLISAGAVPAARPPLYVYFLFLQNLKDFHLTGMPAAWFGATWSLAVEEQFYLVCPLLIRLLSRRVLIVVLIGVVLFTPALRFVVHDSGQSGPALVNLLMPCRADAFAMGILAAILWRNTRLRAYLGARMAIVYALTVVSLGGFVFVAMKWVSQPWALGMQTVGLSVIAVFFVVTLIFILLSPRGTVTSIARARWLREIGTVSYCMYIIHVAIEGICRDILLPAKMHQAANWATVAVLLLAAVLTYAIAKLSWILFERPLQRLGHAYRY